MDDIEAACNLIKCVRNYSKKGKCKTITIKLLKENNRVLSASLNCTFSFAGTPSYGHGMVYCGRKIHPGINNKLTCTNKAALLYLKNSRTRNKKRNDKTKNFNFYESLCSNPQVGLAECIYYNENNIKYYSHFQSKKKLLFVDIE